MNNVGSPNHDYDGDGDGGGGADDVSSLEINSLILDNKDTPPVMLGLLREEHL